MIGSILSELRKDRGWYQKDLADKLGVSISTISNYATDAHYPNIETLIQIVDCFDVSLDYLLGHIRFKTSTSLLNQIVDAQTETTLAELVNHIVNLNEEERHFAVELMELLELRQQQRNSQ